MKSNILKWWEGEYIPHMTDEEMRREQVFIFGGSYRRHWTASTLRAVWGFCAKEWKWVFTASTVLAGLLMTYVRFF